MSDPLQPYDAVVMCSYGGPRKMDDVLPFMRNATSGRGVPDERLIEVSGHYKTYHGVSPINARNNEILQALSRELSERGSTIPVVIGNRNWTPFFHDVMTDLYQQGVRRVLALFTSAYVCYSGCRQYREDLAAALEQMEEQEMTGMVVDKARAFSTTTGFVDSNVDAIVRGFRVEAEKGFGGRRTKLQMVTHSIPQDMFDASGPADKTRPDYVGQHIAVCKAVVERVEKILGHDIEWELSYCSRSGPPHIPWLEPDINDVLERDYEQGVRSVVVSPIGFICDHMEVVFDLDTEAAETAKNLGMSYTRADTPGDEPCFVSSLADVLCERAAQARAEIEGLPSGVGVGYCRDAATVGEDAVTVAIEVAEFADELSVDDQWKGFQATDVVEPVWPAVSPLHDSLLRPSASFQSTVCGG
ncbi:MAG: ferrochelatase [Actinomycetaceae bacterium]|nr:ferrochelatase [Actinomycetaceae bacterium]